VNASLPERRLRGDPTNGTLGTLFFVAAEAMFFLGLVFVAHELRHSSPTWPPPGAPAPDAWLLLGNTVVLLVSSLTMHLAVRALRRDDRRALVRRLVATTLLGLVFLVGQGVEFNRLGGWQPAGSLSRTLFDVLAGMHGLHVTAGLVLLGVVLARARLGQFSARRHLAVSAAEIYWHFVTAVWLVLFAVLVVH